MSSVLRVRKPWRALLGGLTLVLALVLGAPMARAAPPVAVNIVVIEASRTKGKVDPRLKALKLDGGLEDMGYPSGKVMDELSTKVDLDASVTLEILGKSGKARNLKVTVLEANRKTNTVRLKVAIPEFDFATTTNHKKGGTLMVAHKRTKDTALFLAVTPKL